MKMTYAEALEYIHGINWVFCKPGLERTAELCRLLGDPQKKLRFVHVAGTNGKGSFCSMLDSILRAEGYKTGLYTSPYVRVFNERMRYMGENITDDELAEITEYVKGFAEGMTEKPTEFELITCIAFEYFSRKGCDVVILEAGMGGRLDSTNVIETPLASVITGIALDHTAYLGDTEEKIAAEKAGIIKQGVPVLFGGEHEGAYAVISRKSEEMNAPCYRTDRGAIDIKKADRDGTVFDYKQWKNVKINLLGLYQPLNAANVLECVEMLNSRGFTVSSDSVYKGLEAARWQARFEIIRKEPLMIFDGSHNPEGVAAAVATIKRYFGEEKVRVITGVMADKDYMGMVRDISSVACQVYTVRPDNPRALDAEALAEKYRSCGVPATPFDSVETAVHAVILHKNNKTPTVCMGSLYMYCQVMDALEK